MMVERKVPEKHSKKARPVNGTYYYHLNDKPAFEPIEGHSSDATEITFEEKPGESNLSCGEARKVTPDVLSHKMCSN